MTDNINKYESLREKTAGIIESIKNLPSIPAIVMEVSKLIDDPKTSAIRLSGLIGKDQGLVTKVLSVANSPLFGIPRRVSTIDFAIVILGFNHLKSIALALSMIETFRGKNVTQEDEIKYWQHCIMTATASKRLADDLGFNFGGEAFTAGLLHDLGIRIIQNYLGSNNDEIIEMVKKKDYSFHQAELESLGTTHEEIGKYLLDKWNFPPSLSEAVLLHHHPGQSESNRVLTSIIHLADYMTQYLGRGEYYWDENFGLDPEVRKTLDLGNEKYLDRFVNSYRELFEQQIESMKI